jgi:hypothetical protein
LSELENAEVEVALEELENRLERLRALYEQYFMGIERIEPAIPRKDVDRRIYVLRREKIRNTAKRFKLQTIISRYNTFQQYWQRICREIESGTYKRHVIRAERIAPGKMLTIAARKRLGRAALEAAMPDSAAAPTDAQSERTASLPPPPQRAASEAPEAKPVASRASQVPRPGPPAPPTRAAPPAKPARPQKLDKPSAPAVPATNFENTNLDLDFMDDWDPSAATAKPEVPTRPFGQALTPRLGAGPPPSLATTNAPAKPKPGVAPAPPPPPRTPLVKEGLASGAPVAPQAQLVVAPRPPAAPLPAAPPIDAPLHAASRARPAPPRPAARAPAVSAPAAPPSPAPVASSSGIKPMAAPIVRPAAAASAIRSPITTTTAEPAPKLAPAKPAVPAPSAPAVTDARVRELHARLVEAKRQTQDAGTVSMEGLAKSMKATEAKLREQHKNRKIDFDVVIKDGKAVLKPIVR